MDLESYVKQYFPIWAHANKTLALTIPDATFEAEFNEIKAQLQRLGEFFHNGIKKIKAQEQKEQPQEQGPQVDVDLEAFLKEEERKQLSFDNEEKRRMLRHQADMVMLDEKNAKNAGV